MTIGPVTKRLVYSESRWVVTNLMTRRSKSGIAIVHGGLGGLDDSNWHCERSALSQCLLWNGKPRSRCWRARLRVWHLVNLAILVITRGLENKYLES